MFLIVDHCADTARVPGEKLEQEKNVFSSKVFFRRPLGDLQ